MKVLLLVLLAAAAVRCLEETGAAPALQTAAALPADNQPRELQGLKFSQIASKVHIGRRGQDEPNTAQEDLPTEGGDDQPASDSGYSGDNSGNGSEEDAGASDEGTGAAEELPQSVEELELTPEEEAYTEMPMDTRLQNAEAMIEGLRAFSASGESQMTISQEDLESLLMALRDYQVALTEFNSQDAAQNNPEEDFANSHEGGQEGAGHFEPDAEGGYEEFGGEEGGAEESGY